MPLLWEKKMEETQKKFKELTPEEQQKANQQTGEKHGFIFFLEKFTANLDQFVKLLLFVFAMFFSYYILKIKLGLSSQEIRVFWDDWLYLLGSGIASITTFLATSFVPQGEISKKLSSTVKGQIRKTYGNSIAGKEINSK